MAGLALLGMGSCPILAQDGLWKPVKEHSSRYESPVTSTISLIGRPITSKSKIDSSLERAGYGEVKASAPLPVAPTDKSLSFEKLPFPSQASSYSAGIYAPTGTPVQASPIVSYPVGTVTYPTIANNAQIVPVPQGGTVVNGPVMSGTNVGIPYPGEMSYGIDGAGRYGERYFQQAIHGSPGLWYGSFDFINFSVNQDQSPSLVITGTQTPNPQAPALFDVTNPQTLYGGNLPSETMFGGRVILGVWFNRDQTWGMVGSFFTTSTKESQFVAGSVDGATFIGRPYFDTTPGVNAENIERVADIAGQGGSVTIDRSIQLRGADLNFRWNLFQSNNPCSKLFWNIDGYAGARYMGLDESLNVSENLRAYSDVNVLVNGVQQLAFRSGTQTFVQDRFSTRNNFIGGNIGLLAEWRFGRFFIETRGGIALGSTSQEVIIGGSTQYSLPNPVAGQPVIVTPTQPYGLLAQSTNSGSRQQTTFSYVPEFGVKLGLQLTDHVRIHAGYDLMYWTNVVRPGQQIDRNVNSSRIPLVDINTGAFTPGATTGPAQPAFNFNNSNLLINGFNAGLSWVF